MGAGHGSVSGTVADECPGLAPPDDPGAHAPGAGKVVCHADAGPGVDSISDGGGLGTGPGYHRSMGCHLWTGRTQGFDIRAEWGFPPPPALGETQQAELKAAVQELPGQAGIELANWNWRVVHRFVSVSRVNYLCRIPLPHRGMLPKSRHLGPP